MTQLDRIEEKLDAIASMLIAIMEDQQEEPEDEPEFDLSGLVSGRSRDGNQPL